VTACLVYLALVFVIFCFNTALYRSATGSGDTPGFESRTLKGAFAVGYRTGLPANPVPTDPLPIPKSSGIAAGLIAMPRPGQ
jgi:hypothetical protein